MTALDKRRMAQQLCVHEGVEKKPYRCTAGVLTIGVGRNLEDNGLREDEIQLMLENDIEETEAEVTHAFRWYHGLSHTRKMVVIDMVFNLGLSRFMMFAKTITYIQIGDYEAAADEMLDSRWARQVGPRARRLADMMRTNEAVW